MNETYSKLAHSELLSTKDIEALKRIQQQVTKAIEPYCEQILEMQRSLAPSLTKIAKLQEQYIEALRPIVPVLNQHQEKLLPFYQTIVNALNNLDIDHSPDILQEPASKLFEQEILNEIPITLNTLENEFENIPNSREIIEYIKLLEKYFSKGATVVEHLMSYYSFIKLICDILGIPLPPLETQQQVINVTNNINIQSESCNRIDTSIEHTDFMNNQPEKSNYFR